MVSCVPRMDYTVYKYRAINVQCCIYDKLTKSLIYTISVLGGKEYRLQP